MLAYVDVQWQRFWDEVGRPELVNDLRFNTLSNRSDNIAELYKIAGSCLEDRNSEDWIAKFKELDIPCAMITEIEDLFDDPHLKAVGYFKNMKHPTEAT